MSIVRISDASMVQMGRTGSGKLSFKNKLELSKLLDRLGVSVIELEGIEQVKADSLLVKSIASAVKKSVVAVPVSLDPASVEIAWNALKGAAKPRLQVCAPVSTVQMEYLFHKKPADMKAAVVNAVKACRACTDNVEFVADDATRSDPAFLYDVLREVIAAGASTVTVCDAAGAMLPDEFGAFLSQLKDSLPELEQVTLGVSCSNALSMADACVIVAVRHGAREIKTAACSSAIASLEDISKILAAKGSSFDVTCPVHTVELNRVMKQIGWLCQNDRSRTSPFENGVREDQEEIALTGNDTMESVMKAVKELGYELSDEDSMAVWESFRQIASHKEQVSTRELDAIVASAAMQVPATYVLESYVINTGNIISATAHVTMKKEDQTLSSVSLGDGPIDAAFLAIEQCAGRHFELDDFQIRAVTEGKEAMGETVVRLLSGGKLYSGRGISTDILGAAVRAYVNALNKIVYEEAKA